MTLVILTLLFSPFYFLVYTPLEKAQDLSVERKHERIKTEDFKDAFESLRTGDHNDSGRYNQ